MLSNLISAFNQTCLSYVAFTVFSLYFCANFKIKKYFDNDLNKIDKTITNFFNTTTTQIDTTATIQIDNIRGGNVPNYIFVGLLPSANLQGAYDKGATCFKQHNVEELNITLSGNSVSGYPIKIAHGSPIYPLHKFLDSTGRLYNVFSGKTPSYTLFQSCMWIWAHKFEAEMTSQGWIGINLKLSTEFTAEKSMVVWIISPDALTIVINSPGALTVIMNL